MINVLARTAKTSAGDVAGTVAEATEIARGLLHERGEAALHAGTEAAHHAGDAASELVHALASALAPVAERAGDVVHEVPRRSRVPWILALFAIGLVVFVAARRRRAGSEHHAAPEPSVANPHADGGNGTSAAIAGMVGDPRASS